MAEALRSVARDMPAPTGPQFARIVGETAIGTTRGIRLFCGSMSGPRLTEYGFLAVTLGLQSQTGGSLGETLENLADIVRKRVALAARARALASESDRVVGDPDHPALRVRAGHVADPAGLSDPFWNDPTGFKMLVTGLALMTLGAVTSRWLIRRATED